MPLLKDPKARLDREALHWHYPHYYATTTPVSAIHASDWKLLEYHEDSRVELYNLKDDLGETKDLEEALAKNKGIAALSLISKDDPPVFMSYAMAPGQAYPDDVKLARNWKIHHVVHGVELKKLCDKLGVECHLHYPGAKSDYKSASQFLKAKLVGSGDKK